MVLNIINNVVSILFPLITFPYASRALGVSNIGLVNYANSIISYFILFACLGINAYSIREGAKIRDDKEKSKDFVSQMFSLSLISTFFSYAALFALISLSKKLMDYRTVLFALSFQIIGTTIGVDWIFTIYEDFLFATIRNLIVKIISCFALFLFVKNNSDVLIYAYILSGVVLINACLNLIFSRKYLSFKFTLNIDIKKHFKPIMLLFATSLTVSIFVNSDTTLLGLLAGNYAVGIYSVSTKVYLLVKNVLSAIITVSLSRLSYYIGKNDEKNYKLTAISVHNTLLTFLFPAIIGIILLRKEIILILSNITYLQAEYSMTILSVALMASLESWFWGQCILVPNGKEKTVFYSTLVSAIINLCLNLLLIPLFKENAAAFTTLISETVCFMWAYYIGRVYISNYNWNKEVVKIIIGCIAIIISVLIVRHYFANIYIVSVLSICFASIMYFVIEYILDNSVIREIVNSILARIY